MGSTKISPDQFDRIKLFTEKIKKEFKSITKVTVFGYAQPTVGTESVDKKISKERALNVAKLLKKLGIAEISSIQGLGRTNINVSSSRYVQVTLVGQASGS